MKRIRNKYNLKPLYLWFIDRIGMSERNRGVGKFGLFSAKNYIRYNESAGISRFSMAINILS